MLGKRFVRASQWLNFWDFGQEEANFFCRRSLSVKDAKSLARMHISLLKKAANSVFIWAVGNCHFFRGSKRAKCRPAHVAESNGNDCHSKQEMANCSITLENEILPVLIDYKRRREFCQSIWVVPLNLFLNLITSMQNMLNPSEKERRVANRAAFLVLLYWSVAPWLHYLLLILASPGSLLGIFQLPL